MKAEVHQESIPRSFQLRGTLEGKAAAFTLWAGVISVGSLEESDIHLPVAAVSRRHAVFEIGDGHVLVRDLESKNGTWVNGERVTETVIHPGDEIGFGPVLFHLVEMDPEDAVLAIQSEQRRPVPCEAGSELETRTQIRRSTDQPPMWVTLLDELAALVFHPGEPRLAASLERLMTTLGAQGALLAEVREGGATVVLAAAGRTVPALDGRKMKAALGEARSQASSEGGGVASFALDSPEPVTGAVGVLPMTTMTLLLSGDFRHRGAARPLLQLMMRMFLVEQRPPVQFESASLANEPPPELVFPAGYVPGHSPAIKAVYEQLRQLQLGDIPVLITGETGVGKELIARCLHGSSERREGPFVAVNCAAIPSELLEAELFGIERGVATGVEAREGKFQLARGGTLFLDEIADMSAGLQAKLLRTLQEMEVHPLGARLPLPVDVRIFSATNTDLQTKILDKLFRRDLYFRIAGFALRVPPLRERRDDIPALVEHFMRRYATEIGKPVRGITVKALRLLMDAPWPGNVRELEHEVRRLVYLCPPNQAIDSGMLSESVLSPTLSMDTSAPDSALDLNLDHHTAELERKLITLALGRTHGNITRAAELLGLSRNGLKKRMARYGIEAATE